MLHISIKAEEVASIYGFPLTNSLLASYIVLALFFIIAYLFNKNSKNKKSMFVFFVLFICNGLYSMFQPILKDKTKLFFPLIASFLLFILLSNWFGLLPGVGSVMLKHTPATTNMHEEAPIEQTKNEHGETVVDEKQEKHEESVPLLRAGTADLNMTIALGLISVVLIQFFSIKYLGLGGYIKKFINLSNPINFFVGILEIVSEASRVVSFAFRLFGNIFAGEVLISVVAFLLPVYLGFATFPLLMLEIFVGFIQAIVFAMLTAVFLNMAISEQH